MCVIGSFALCKSVLNIGKRWQQLKLTMNYIKSLLILVPTILFFSCNKTLEKDIENIQIELQSDRIKVLNFGTFHMGFTNDAHSHEFNENSKKNIDSVHQIAKMLSIFKPTVIIVETSPSYDITLQENYSKYLKDSNIIFKNQDEVELLAFELGRLSETKRIYGIDHKLQYYYNINNEITNSIDSITYNEYNKDPFESNPELAINFDALSLLNKFKLMNNQKFLDYLIEFNADILTHVGTDNNFEGADEAAKFYQRNLRMYSNLNRISLKKDDRVFILMGGAHTAFFRDFMNRSPKYEMINTFNYLK